MHMLKKKVTQLQKRKRIIEYMNNIDRSDVAP